MKLSEFDYKLPRELIAQYPAEEREKCRLMVLDRQANSISHKTFKSIVDYFNKGDLLALNNTKVVPARLLGSRKTGGKVEIFVLDRNGTSCEALVKPSGRINIGERITLESGHEAQVLGSGKIGRMIQFSRSIDEIMTKGGHMPLPPYIDRADEERDKIDYQTVYACREGATASPTAGLHFTKELLNRIMGNGVRVTYVTLHTNYGTFAPIKTDEIEKHRMHREYFELSAETAKVVAETKKSGGKVFAVGTTTTRVLEHCADVITNDERRTTDDVRGYADMFIYPGYKFKVVDHMITNFHLPKSTLLLLISAFAGRDFIFKAYNEAIEKRYRFFSYGDAMLIL